METLLLGSEACRGRNGTAAMLDIPAVRTFGVFDTPGPTGDPAALVTACKQAALSAHGTIGPEFVHRLIAGSVTGDDLRALVAGFATALVPLGADGQVDRAAQRLGLIMAAGELATEFGLTGWCPGEARAAAAWALQQWISGRGGTEAAEVRQAVEQVRLFIEQHGEARFQDLRDPDARPVSNRAGYARNPNSYASYAGYAQI